MKHTEYSWELAGKKVFAQSWMPEKDPVAIINLVHGLGEHSGRYSRWAGLFAGAGYGVVSTDLFGHGKTEGRIGHVKTYQLLLDQVDLLLAESEMNYPGIPRILYGHSMGGNIAINYAISKDPPFSALIASSPWLRLVIPVSALERVGSRVANSIVPGLVIRAKGLGAEKLSHDPDHWDSVRNDPLVHRKVSIRYAHEMMKQGENAISHGSRIKKPFLLMHGDADEITSNAASTEFMAGTPDTARLKIWEGLRHELHNELEHKDVFKFVVDWIGSLKPAGGQTTNREE